MINMLLDEWLASQQYQCTHNCAALWAARVFLNLSTTNNANKQA